MLRTLGRLRAGGQIPTLLLDFTTALLDSRIDASGGSGGTRVNSSGVIVAATTPRFDYDPITLACKGVLIEEQRTNLLLQSEAFDNASWTKLNATAAANAGTGPDGTASADRIVPAASTAVHAALQSVTVTASTPYTDPIYVKADGATHVQVVYDDGASNGAFMNVKLSDGTITRGPEAAGTGTQVAGDVKAAGNGWYRIRVTAQHGATTGRVGICPLTTAAANSGIFPSIATLATDAILVWGAQLEAGSFATSYIPTTTAAVTRTADSLVMTGSNFSSWFNAAQGTFYADADTIRPSGTAPILIAQIGGGNDRHQVSVFGPTAATVVGGVVQASIGTNVAQSAKTAYAYAANDFATSTGGALPATDSSGSVPSPTYLTIGKFDFGGGESLNGHVKTLRYYPQRLPNSTLQVLTT